MFFVGSMLFAPALAMGIAQQDPAHPAAPGQQQLQQDPAAAAQPESDVVGVIAEVRDDSFSVRKDSDQSVVWFSLTPELKSSYSAELVTGNHVRVAAMPGESPDRMMASSISAEGEAKADLDVDLDADKDTDLDADVKIDEDSATATIDRDTTLEDNDTAIAQNETDTSLREDTDTYDTDSDELPKTASSLPEIATFGLLALIGGAVVAFARRF
jgi:recombination DNA repair RAD52 pathway protein